MKNYLKTSKWLRWVAAGVFGVMLVFNVMISLEFEKEKTLPSLTLTELGNRAYAQSESGGENPPTCLSECTYSYSFQCSFHTVDHNGTPIIATCVHYRKR